MVHVSTNVSSPLTFHRINPNPNPNLHNDTTRQLTTAASLAKFLCPTKAIVRTFETTHNYADNTNTYTKVSQPSDYVTD